VDPSPVREIVEKKGERGDMTTRLFMKERGGEEWRKKGLLVRERENSEEREDTQL